MNELTTELVTMDAVSLMEIELVEGLPLWLVVLGISAALILLLCFMMISWVIHAGREVKKQVHHQPSSHEVMVELQKEVLRSMAATSKQNWLMIWLTVLFITVSVLGGAVVMNFVQNIGNFSATWLAQFLEFLNSIFGQ